MVTEYLLPLQLYLSWISHRSDCFAWSEKTQQTLVGMHSILPMTGIPCGSPKSIPVSGHPSKAELSITGIY